MSDWGDSDSKEVGGNGNESGDGNEQSNGHQGRRGDEGGYGGRGRGRDFGGGRGDRGYRGDRGDNDNNGDNDDRQGGGYRGRGDRNRNRGGGGENGRGEGRNGYSGGDDYENGEPEKIREFYIPPEPTDDEEKMFGSGITTGIHFNKYDNIPVKVTGDNPPPCIKTFEEAELRELVLNNISKSGYKVPTPIQKAAIPAIKAGRDLMACAQTGSGKTAAFLVPIINALLEEGKNLSIGQPQALIISPTRELSVQIYEQARKFAHGSYLKTCCIYGGTSSKHQNEKVSNGCHILICTPGRLLDFVDRTFVTFEETRFVVLDEADRMLDMGFKDSVHAIMNHQTMRPMTERQNLMFSATFPGEIQMLAADFLRDYIFITIGVVGGACNDVVQTIYEVKKFDKRKKLLELLHVSAEGTIVFVETKRGADFLASLLSETDYPTTSIHGDRLQSQREQALLDFKTGRMKVLIATSVAARGLDIKNIKHVVNYDMPKSIDEFVHRIGRTGRLGNSGTAASFFDPEQDAALAGPLITILEGANQEVPDFLRAYGIGGGRGASQSKFGGRDMRKRVDEFPNGADEEEEDWG